MGKERFSVGYERSGPVIRASASGPGDKATRLEVTVPVGGMGAPVAVTVDGEEPTKCARVRYLGRESVRVQAEIPAGKTVTVAISGK